MRHPKSLAVSFKLLIINNSIYLNKKATKSGNYERHVTEFQQQANAV